LEQIASDAGFTKGALYSHFAGREDLFLEVAEQRAVSMTETWCRLTQACSTPATVARVLGQWLEHEFSTNRGWLLGNLEFSAIAARDPQLAQPLIARLRRAHYALGEIMLEKAGIDGHDPRRMGALAMSLIDGIIIHAALDTDLDIAARTTDGLLRLLTGNAYSG